LLGKPEVLIAGTPLILTDQKARALLFYLAATGQPHTRDHITSLLWSESPSGDARHSLRPAFIVCAGPEVAQPLAGLMGLDDPAAVFQRFASGRRCYAAWVEGTLAAYGWVSFGEEEIGEMRLRIRLAPGEAYIWDCATALAYRRRRLYTALLGHIADELRAGGLCRAWIGVDPDNLASQKGIALAGFRPVADLIVARALAMRLVWVRGRPGAPEYVVADARRALLGDRDRAWLAALSSARATPAALLRNEV
jgi:ribosomal protein S18 acetylase RimI-like enzyme